jgi:hypothetical protein
VGPIIKSKKSSDGQLWGLGELFMDGGILNEGWVSFYGLLPDKKYIRI